MNVSSELKRFAVKIQESLDVEQAMATANRMLNSLDILPTNKFEIVPGIVVWFESGTAYLQKGKDIYFRDSTGIWNQK
jgi:hypothetical protein